MGLSFPSFYVRGTQALGEDRRPGSAILTSGPTGATLGPLLPGPTLEETGKARVFPAMAILGLGGAAFAVTAARLWRAAPT